jgi:hypothetical protein
MSSIELTAVETVSAIILLLFYRHEACKRIVVIKVCHQKTLAWCLVSHVVNEKCIFMLIFKHNRTIIHFPCAKLLFSLYCKSTVYCTYVFIGGGVFLMKVLVLVLYNTLFLSDHNPPTFTPSKNAFCYPNFLSTFLYCYLKWNPVFRRIYWRCQN